MKKRNLLWLLVFVHLFLSCTKREDWPPPTVFSFVLMNSDSSSVLTSKEDKVVIKYRDNGMMRQFYDVSVDEREGVYFVSSISALYSGVDSLYIEAKSKIDTLVLVKTPLTMPKFTSQILLLFSKVLHILEKLLLKNFTGLKVVS